MNTKHLPMRVGYLAAGPPAKVYEAGVDQRVVVAEFDSVAQAIAAHDSPGYQAALAVLGNAAVRHAHRRRR